MARKTAGSRIPPGQKTTGACIGSGEPGYTTNICTTTNRLVVEAACILGPLC